MSEDVSVGVKAVTKNDNTLNTQVVTQKSDDQEDEEEVNPSGLLDRKLLPKDPKKRRKVLILKITQTILFYYVYLGVGKYNFFVNISIFARIFKLDSWPITLPHET